MCIRDSIYLLTCCIVALITEYVDLTPSGFVRPSFARRLALQLQRKAKASLALRTSKKCTSVATKGQENCGTQNQSNVEQKQQNTDHTRQESSGQGQGKNEENKTRSS